MVWGMLAALGGQAVSAGINAAQRSRAKEVAEKSADRAAAQRKSDYREAQQGAVKSATDAAMHQQMSMARGRGTLGSQASAMQAASQRMPSVMAQAQLAGARIGEGYAAGADQARTAGVGRAIGAENLRRGPEGNLMKGLGAGAGLIGAGIDSALGGADIGGGASGGGAAALAPAMGGGAAQAAPAFQSPDITPGMTGADMRDEDFESPLSDKRSKYLSHKMSDSRSKSYGGSYSDSRSKSYGGTYSDKHSKEEIDKLTAERDAGREKIADLSGASGRPLGPWTEEDSPFEAVGPPIEMSVEEREAKRDRDRASGAQIISAYPERFQEELRAEAVAAPEEQARASARDRAYQAYQAPAAPTPAYREPLPHFSRERLHRGAQKIGEYFTSPFEGPALNTEPSDYVAGDTPESPLRDDSYVTYTNPEEQYGFPSWDKTKRAVGRLEELWNPPERVLPEYPSANGTTSDVQSKEHIQLLESENARLRGGQNRQSGPLRHQIPHTGTGPQSADWQAKNPDFQGGVRQGLPQHGSGGMGGARGPTAEDVGFNETASGRPSLLDQRQAIQNEQYLRNMQDRQTSLESGFGGGVPQTDSYADHIRSVGNWRAGKGWTSRFQSPRRGADPVKTGVPVAAQSTEDWAQSIVDQDQAEEDAGMAALQQRREDEIDAAMMESIRRESGVTSQAEAEDLRDELLGPEKAKPPRKAAPRAQPKGTVKKAGVRGPGMMTHEEFQRFQGDRAREEQQRRMDRFWGLSPSDRLESEFREAVSDEGAKNKGGGTEAADTFRETPGFKYHYKPEFLGEPGTESGEQFGIMAQDLEKTEAGASVVDKDENGMRKVDTERLTLLNSAALHDIMKELDKRSRN